MRVYSLVFPAASNPSISRRISLDPKILSRIFDIPPPMVSGVIEPWAQQLAYVDVFGGRVVWRAGMAIASMRPAVGVLDEHVSVVRASRNSPVGTRKRSGSWTGDGMGSVG